MTIRTPNEAKIDYVLGGIKQFGNPMDELLHEAHGVWDKHRGSVVRLNRNSLMTTNVCSSVWGIFPLRFRERNVLVDKIGVNLGYDIDVPTLPGQVFQFPSPPIVPVVIPEDWPSSNTRVEQYGDETVNPPTPQLPTYYTEGGSSAADQGIYFSPDTLSLADTEAGIQKSSQIHKIWNPGAKYGGFAYVRFTYTNKPSGLVVNLVSVNQSNASGETATIGFWEDDYTNSPFKNDYVVSVHVSNWADILEGDTEFDIVATSINQQGDVIKDTDGNPVTDTLHISLSRTSATTIGWSSADDLVYGVDTVGQVVGGYVSFVRVTGVAPLYWKLEFAPVSWPVGSSWSFDYGSTVPGTVYGPMSAAQDVYLNINSTGMLSGSTYTGVLTLKGYLAADGTQLTNTVTKNVSVVVLVKYTVNNLATNYKLGREDAGRAGDNPYIRGEVLTPYYATAVSRMYAQAVWSSSAAIGGLSAWYSNYDGAITYLITTARSGLAGWDTGAYIGKVMRTVRVTVSSVPSSTLPIRLTFRASTSQNYDSYTLAQVEAWPVFATVSAMVGTWTLQLSSPITLNAVLLMGSFQPGHPLGYVVNVAAGVELASTLDIGVEA